MFSLGLDIGCSSLKLSLLDDQALLVNHVYQPHQGRIRAILIEALAGLADKYGRDRIAWGAVTGSGAKMLSQEPGIHYLNEIQAVVEGCLAVGKEAVPLSKSAGRVPSILPISGLTTVPHQNFDQFQLLGRYGFLPGRTTIET